MTDVSYRRRGQPTQLTAPMPDTRTLVLMAQDLMTRTLSCFTGKGVVPPTRQVIYMAPIPADCEQVAVMFSGWTPMPPWVDLTHCDIYRWVANFSVIITRCTPANWTKGGKVLPDPEQMLRAAEIASADAEVLLCLVASVDEIGPAVQILTPSPQGGMQTVELTIEIPAVGGLD
jgi:hypothetical protein